jgi:hypothetical protein
MNQNETAKEVRPTVGDGIETLRSAIARLYASVDELVLKIAPVMDEDKEYMTPVLDGEDTTVGSTEVTKTLYQMANFADRFNNRLINQIAHVRV